MNISPHTDYDRTLKRRIRRKKNLHQGAKESQSDSKDDKRKKHQAENQHWPKEKKEKIGQS